MTKKKIVTGVVAGIAIGGILGYLFATEKGAQTRQKIADETGSFFDEVVGHFMDMMQKGKDKAGNLLDEGVAAAEKVKMSGSI